MDDPTIPTTLPVTVNGKHYDLDVYDLPGSHRYYKLRFEGNTLVEHGTVNDGEDHPTLIERVAEMLRHTAPT